ncbi:MAG: DUF362 domain-containing protein [Acidobacteriota bacterium]
MKRREFIKKSALTASAVYLSPVLAYPASSGKNLVARVTGESPYDITKRSVEMLGGMKEIISKQDIVMIKPNIGWNRKVEQAANTNPEVLRAIIEMVFDAGAKKVIVMDNPCHKAEDTYRRSGIKAVVEKSGADLRYTDENRLVIHNFKGEKLKKWPVFKDFLEVDKFINVPILKHHASAGLTIGMKNLYGIIGGRRGKLHRNMGENIADLAKGFKTHLTIIDAYRILKKNGPVGGRLSDVELKKTIICSRNILEGDVVAVDLFGKKIEDVPFIEAAFKRGMGEKDITKINLKSLNI